MTRKPSLLLFCVLLFVGYVLVLHAWETEHCVRWSQRDCAACNQCLQYDR